MRTFRRLPGRTRASVITVALLVGATLVVRGAADTDADLQLQLATLLYDETRYQEALQAFDQATRSRRPAHCRSRPQRYGPHVAEGRRVRPGQARSRGAAEASRQPTLKRIALYGDALWSAGLFDEADRAYRDGLGAGAGFVARALRRRPLAGRHQPSGRGARHGARRLGDRAARRRDPRPHRRHLRAAAPVRAGRQLVPQLHQPAAQQGPQREGGMGPRPGRLPRLVRRLGAGGDRRAGPEHAPHDPLHAA